MHTEEWSGQDLAAVLASLDEAGYSQSRLARLTGINQSTLSRWGKAKVRPGYDAARKVAAAVWREQPGLARELVEASGYAWAEPAGVEAPPPTPLEEMFGTEGAEEVRAKIRRHKGADADYYISRLELVLGEPPASADDCPGPGASPARRQG